MGEGRWRERAGGGGGGLWIEELLPEIHGLNAKSLFLSCTLTDLTESHSYQDKLSCFLKLFRMLFGVVLLLQRKL